MVIDKKSEGLTDMSGNFLDIYLDENNNSFSNIDNLSTTTYQLPKPTFFFEDNSTSCIDLKRIEKRNEEDNLKLKFNHLKSDQDREKQKQNYEPLSKRSVKRALFVNKTEIDHEANLDLVVKQMEQLVNQDSEKWNFDFKNNCPLNNQNSQYEWFNDSILSNLTNLDTNNLSSNDKLNLKIKKISSSTSSSSSNPTSLSISTIKNEKKISSSSSSSTFEMLLRNSTNTITNNTRSVKRRLNLNDYFQPAKKRANIPSQKNQKPTDQVLSSLNNNNACKFVEIKKLNVDAKSTKFQKPTTSKQASSKQDIRKSRSQRRQQQKNQKTQKDKKQTTLKFLA